MDAVLLLTGFSYAVLQILVLRELLVAFSGSELAVGLILGAWLLAQAAGSWLAGRLGRFLPAQPRWYALVPASLSLLLLPTLAVAIQMRAWLGAVPGAEVGFGTTFLASLLALAPVGSVGGAALVIACRVLPGAGAGPAPPDRREWAAGGAGRGGSQPRAGAGVPAGRVYALEAAGSIAGGIAFTYLLLPLWTSTQIVLLLAAANALAAAAVWWRGKDPRPAGGAIALALVGLAGLAALTAALLPAGTALHQRLVAGRWAPHTLAWEGNSPYGNVAVLQGEGQIAVFVNGGLALTAPDPDAAAVEQLVHLPALFLDAPPRRVLVIGGGAGGVLHELERYPLEQLDYAEPDPLLVSALEVVPTPLTADELAYGWLRFATGDARRFVQRAAAGEDLRRRVAAEDGPEFAQHAAGPYDLVLLHLPPPTTLVLNRLYTREFMALVAGCLAPRGVLAVSAPPARTYLAPAAAGLLAGQQRTLAAALAHVRMVPADEQTLWLASPENPLDLDAAELARRWEERGLEGRVLRADYLRYLLDPAVEGELRVRVAAAPAEVNRDAVPAGLRQALAYESARLAPEWEPFWQQLGQLRGWHAAAAVALLTAAGLLLVRKRRPAAVVAVGTTGLAGMTVSVVVLLAFQVVYGSLYRQIGLLTTAFMAGLSLGAAAMTAWAGRLRRPWGTLLQLEGAHALGAAGLAGLLGLVLGHADPDSYLAHALLLAANAAAGLLVGLEFPLAGRLAAAGDADSRAAGMLYAADLAGAMVGAACVAALLLPTLGLMGTVLLVALIKGGSLILAARAGAARTPRQSRPPAPGAR